MTISTKTFNNPKGEVVGSITNGVYVSDRNKRHFMRIFQGYGLSESIIEELIKLECHTILILYTGAKGNVKRLKSNFSQWIESTQKFTDTSMGFSDPQVFVSEKDMEVLA